LPDKCETGSSIVCENFVLNADGTADLEFRNRVGKVINILDVTVEGQEDWAGIVDCSGSGSGNLVNGNLQVVNMSTCYTADTYAGQKIKAGLVVSYTVADSSITQKASGEIQATIAE